MDQMSFSKWPRVQDTQSRYRMGKYSCFFQEGDEAPDEGKLEGKLQQEYFYGMINKKN